MPSSLFPATVGQESSECRTLTLPVKTVDNHRIYRLNDTVSFSIGYESDLDSRTDYGARLMLLTQSAGVFNRTYYSAGAGDSYGIRPTFIANCGKNELLVLGEISTEYSWGVRVFSYNEGDVHDLGTIPLAIEGEIDASSVVPFMRFTQGTGHSAIVSFTNDLIRNPGSPDESKIPKSSIRYRIDGNKLTEIQP